MKEPARRRLPDEAGFRRLRVAFHGAAVLRRAPGGSLEPGKLADFIVIDTDVLTCPPEKIAQTKVLRTYLGGKQVFERKDATGT